MFEVRVVTLDHYLAKPIDEIGNFQDETSVKEWLEPVIRIFGSTTEGVRTCVHVHGVYPYMYVPYPGGEHFDRDALLLGTALDEALKLSFLSKSNRFVFKVTLHSGIPLYGYHSNPRLFFKIQFYNPYHIKKASELLLSGAVLGQKFQPHEAHIPYALQFMIDYNIYGMSFVQFSSVKYRRNSENPGSLVHVKSEDILSEKVEKMSCSCVEVDAWASDILNKSDGTTEILNPGLRAIWEDEKQRRKDRNDNSEITIEVSESRPLVPVCPVEQMLKAKLAQKLEQIPPEVSEKLRPPFPTEKSFRVSADSQSVGDVSRLVDESVLTQIARGGDEGEEGSGSDEEEEMEGDSVLRGEKRTGEVRVEEEEEEEVDMTQPLEFQEVFIRDREGTEEGPGTEDTEAAFWKSMAEKIFQLDGTLESSSESETEVALSKLSGTPTDSSSSWSGNIMSLLGEDGGCVAPFATCQTPRSFWTNYPSTSLPHNQDSWSWGKHPTAGLFGKAQTETLNAVEFSGGPKEIVSEEVYGELFASSEGEFFGSSEMTPMCAGSAESTVSPLSAVPTPASEAGSSYNDLESICESLSCSSEQVDGKATDGGPGSFLEVLKSFAGRKLPCKNDRGQLTLKQYIKDCEEIVSVDFKTLCNQEMIIIEYKSLNKKSVQNKYLIKPLEKFLEKWNSAEEKVNGRESTTETRADGNGGLTTRAEGGVLDLGKEKNLCSVIKFSDSSTVKSVSNKVTLKSMEIVPKGGGGGKNRCYNINKNVISQGKIRMKLIKSQRENVDDKISGQRVKSRSREKCIKYNLKKKEERRRKEEKKEEKRKNFTKSDAKLINEINSSFEEYFRTIVERRNPRGRNKRKLENGCGKNEKLEETEDGSDDDAEEGEEEDDEDAEDTSEDDRQTVKNVCKHGDPVMMVTRFLSSFSRMSDMPPLSITVSFGDSRTSVPVQVNMQPMNGEAKRERGKERKSTKLEMVDGPADGSSEEETESEDFKRRIRGKKREKKENYYKPLNVVVYGMSSETERGRRKRKIGGEAALMESAEEEDRRKHSSFSSSSSQDSCQFFRAKRRRSSEGEKRKEEISDKTLVKNERVFLESIKLNASHGSAPEQDFIDDSDEEKKRKLLARRRKDVKRRTEATKKIPQADTDAFTSSDDDQSNLAIEKARSDTGKTSKEDQKKERKAKSERCAAPSETQLYYVEKISFSGGSSALKFVEDERPNQGTLSPFTLSGSPLFTLEDNPEAPGCSTWRSEGASASVSSTEKEKCFSQAESSSGDKEEKKRSSSKERFVDCVIGSKRLRPQWKPPTRREVIASHRGCQGLGNESEAPFYGDPRDETKKMETGPKVLTIESRSLTSLKSFKSCLEVLGTEERRDMMRGEQKVCRWELAGSERINITPLIKPPALKFVLDWTQCKRECGGKKLRKQKIKVQNPVSSEEEVESEEELELSVSLSGFSVGTERSEEEQQQGIRKKKTLSQSDARRRLPLLEKSGLMAEGEEKCFASVASAPSGSSNERRRNSDGSFQIKGVSVANSFGFSGSVENLQDAKRRNRHQFMSVLVMELHVQTRKNFLPDPELDPIRALFYTVTFDDPAKVQETGVLVVGERRLSEAANSHLRVHHVSSEKDLVGKFLQLVKLWDPEILTGYEIETKSWGYLVQRGYVLEMNLILLLGRVRPDVAAKNPKEFQGSGEDVHDVPRSIRRMRISGRIVLDAWRVLRHELALTSYTFENVAYNLTHERHPLLSHETLSRYWEHASSKLRHVVVEHYWARVVGLIRILEQLDFINRTSELSRLFGIQFYEVLSRGSQFRVESMMLRLAKPLGYVPTSPSISQRAAMRAPASLPLILEPESLFYSDPVIVLDFQSLYPSIIIAYNYCFSTCLGRVEKLGGREPFEFGCSQLEISPEELKSLEKDVNISPAGVAFVKPNIRKGVLPRMLEEILETRLMVKKSMKANKSDKILEKVLYARQLGLKLIANVTYGYTAANFSGRMPCIEVGDSVVSKGRETLHRAIQLVKNTRKWGAEVVYGDTDSMFVLTPGRTRKEAFEIGAEIADAVTKDNPKPVKLKLEKVYQPCILQTKKRYVGHMFESPNQEEPVLEAKGIETVRRDGCPATKKILVKALEILFDTKDVSLVKKYAVRQFAKLIQGRVNAQDLIFAKEYRGRKGYRPGACVPALQLARQWTAVDKRAEPRTKERVPYVIVNGPPGVPLIRLVRSPNDLLSDPSLRINAVYYITKAIIPPMQRCFSLLGADVSSWFAEMPRKYHRSHRSVGVEGSRKITLSQYFAAVECVVCSEITSDVLCRRCQNRAQDSSVALLEKIRRWERSHQGLVEICRSCSGRPTAPECESLDCPVLFRRKQSERDLDQSPALRQVFTRLI